MLEVLGFTGEGGGESSLLRRLPRPWRAGVGSLCPGDGIATPTQGMSFLPLALFHSSTSRLS